MYENDFNEGCFEDNYSYENEEMYDDYYDRDDYSYDQSMYDACDGMEDAYWNID